MLLLVVRTGVIVKLCLVLRFSITFRFNWTGFILELILKSGLILGLVVGSVWAKVTLFWWEILCGPLPHPSHLSLLYFPLWPLLSTGQFSVIYSQWPLDLFLLPRWIISMIKSALLIVFSTKKSNYQRSLRVSDGSGWREERPLLADDQTNTHFRMEILPWKVCGVCRTCKLFVFGCLLITCWACFPSVISLMSYWHAVFEWIEWSFHCRCCFHDVTLLLRADCFCFLLPYFTCE